MKARGPPGGQAGPTPDRLISAFDVVSLHLTCQPVGHPVRYPKFQLTSKVIERDAGMKLTGKVTRAPTRTTTPIRSYVRSPVTLN
jgi:hypothetical protein